METFRCVKLHEKTVRKSGLKTPPIVFQKCTLTNTRHFKNFVNFNYISIYAINRNQHSRSNTREILDGIKSQESGRKPSNSQSPGENWVLNLFFITKFRIQNFSRLHNKFNK